MAINTLLNLNDTVDQSKIDSDLMLTKQPLVSWSMGAAYNNSLVESTFILEHYYAEEIGLRK